MSSMNDGMEPEVSMKDEAEAALAAWVHSQHLVWHLAGEQTVSHLGQPSFSHMSLGQRTEQTGRSQWIVHLAHGVSSHEISHLGRSHTGWHTAGHDGSSHCHLHSGWHSAPSVELAAMEAPRSIANRMKARIVGLLFKFL